MTDAFGEPLEIGDFVGYITGGRYQDTVKGRVLQFKKLTQIEVTKTVGHCFVKPGDKIWIHAHRATKTLESFDSKVKFTLIDAEGNEEKR